MYSQDHQKCHTWLALLQLVFSLHLRPFQLANGQNFDLHFAEKAIRRAKKIGGKSSQI